MLNFLICGIAFLLYAYVRFVKTKIFYPSIVFSFMWGANCIITSLVLCGIIDNLYLDEYYSFKYMDDYIILFTAVSLGAFLLAHKIHHDDDVNMEFNLDLLNTILRKYHWIMWVNFFGGLLRIILMVRLVGFDNVMDYRVAANQMMNSGAGDIGMVFRLTAYIQMLANFYVAFYGFNAGFEELDFKNTLKIFILYAPTQMATGGRLFILYFILFFFGAFLLGRGISVKISGRKLLLSAEKNALIISFIGLLSLVSIIAMARQKEYSEGGESALAKFTYIAEGTVATEHCMRLFDKDNVPKDNGEYLFHKPSKTYLSYRASLLTTKMSSVVICIITPLYTGFGYWGSLFIWFAIALVLELGAISCLNKLTIIRFLIYFAILKIFYESVMSNPIAENIPIYELIIIFAVLYKPIFGSLEIENE